MRDVDPRIFLVIILVPVFLVVWLKMPGSSSIIRRIKFWMIAPGAMIGLLCLPVLLYEVYHQVGAHSRLVAFGLPDSNYFSYCAGAQGGRAPRFVWRFSLRTVPSELVEKYSARACEDGWKADRKSDGSVVLIKGQKRVCVSVEQFGDERHFVIEKIR